MTVEKLLHDTFDKYERYTPDAADLHQDIRRSPQMAGRRPTTRRPRTHPGSRTSRARLVPVAASAVVLVLAGGAIVGLAVTGNSGDTDLPAASGAPFDPPSGLSSATPSASQFSYRVDQQIDLNAAGKAIPNGQDAMVDRKWVSANGDVRSIRSGSQTGCTTFAYDGAGFPGSNRMFFHSLPTDVPALTRIFRAKAEGSSSRDEAVFVAVGDALRTADGFASPRLRAAMLAMVSRTPGVFVHEHARDYAGRTAIRADFVDQRTRPGEIRSLYFDPVSFQLVEERDSSTGSSTSSVPSSVPSPSSTSAVPSPAYTAHPSTTGTPAELTGAAYIDVMRAEKTLDTLPPLPAGCKSD